MNTDQKKLIVIKHAQRKAIAIKLRQLRFEKDLSQRQLADKLKIKVRTYASYEEHRAEPPVFMLRTICEFHGLTVDQFLSDIPTKSFSEVSSTQIN